MAETGEADAGQGPWGTQTTVAGPGGPPSPFRDHKAPYIPDDTTKEPSTALRMGFTQNQPQGNPYGLRSLKTGPPGTSSGRRQSILSDSVGEEGDYWCRRSPRGPREAGVILGPLGLEDPTPSASDNGDEVGEEEGGPVAAAYRVAAKLRRLSLRARRLAQEELGSPRRLSGSSPRSPAAAESRSSSAVPHTETWRALEVLSQALEDLTEDAALAATHSDRWKSAASRQKRQLNSALEENERLLADNQTLSEELKAAQQRCLNSEAELQQLSKYKNYQAKFFACQSQVAQLQFEMETLRRGFEALEAAHATQEEELKKTTETAALLRQRLRAACEELAQTKEALSRQLASSQRVQSDTCSSAANPPPLDRPAAAHRGLGSMPRSPESTLRWGISRGYPPSSEGSHRRDCDGPRVFRGQTWCASGGLRGSSLRQTLRASLSQDQQQKRQQQQQQQQRLSRLSSDLTPQAPSGPEEWHLMRFIQSEGARSTGASASIRPAAVEAPAAAAARPEAPAPSTGRSLYEELAASVAAAPARPKAKAPRKHTEEETLAADALQQLLSILAKSSISLDELRAHGVSSASLLQVSRLRKNLETQQKDKTPSSSLQPTEAAQREPVGPHVGPLAAASWSNWLPPVSSWLRESLSFLLRPLSGCLGSERVPAARNDGPPHKIMPLSCSCVRLGAPMECTCALLIIMAAVASALWLRLGDWSVD